MTARGQLMTARGRLMTARAAGTLALNAAVIGWAIAGRTVGMTSPAAHRAARVRGRVIRVIGTGAVTRRGSVGRPSGMNRLGFVNALGVVTAPGVVTALGFVAVAG